VRERREIARLHLPAVEHDDRGARMLVADGERAQAAEQDFALGHGANRFLSARNRASYR